MDAVSLALVDGAPLHHVGIVSPDERQALLQISRLGLREDFRGYVERWDVLCIFTKCEQGSPVEFVVPFSGPLLEFNGRLGGIHHIALRVPDIRATMEQLALAGVKMVESEPVKGAGNFWCNFLPPIFTRGFAVELVEPFEPADIGLGGTAGEPKRSVADWIRER